MASLIYEIENNEALLLMFLTGELGPEDRAEVEQMLANDAGLRKELALIESSYNAAIGVLQKLDADRTAIPAENHAVRQAMRAMKQWQVDRLSRRPILLPPVPASIPMWIYPLGSVAALLIGAIAWWGFGGSFGAGSGSFPGFWHGSSVASADHGASTLPGESVGNGSSQASEVPVPLTPEDVTANRLADSLSADVGLSDAETQARTLAHRSDAAAVSLESYLTEANP